MPTDISVIVCTYNRCECLKLLLNDLEGLKVSPVITWEIIVVDNNSKDQTRAVVENYISKGGMNLRYLFEGRPGKSNALNAGIGAAKGEIIAFTDDDATVDPDWLSQLKSTFDIYQCVGVGGKIIPVWTCERPSWFNVVGPYKLMAAIVEFDLGDDPCPITTPVWGANMAFRKSVFDKYGLFRTDLGPNPENLVRGEDSEFSWRLIHGGENFIYAPKAVVFHPVEEKRTKKSYFESWYFNFGRASIRTEGIPQNTACYFGVPRYLLRHLMLNLFKWGFSFDSQRRFYHKLNLYRVAGEITEAYNVSATSR